jgi:hypothetical protein
MKHLFRLALLIVLVVTAIGIMPKTEKAEAVSCDVLHVTATVWNSLPTPYYRVNGVGPGLPSAAVGIPSATWVTITWVIYGPGAWDGLYLEYANGPSAVAWTFSTYPLTASGTAAGCDALVPLPETAVVGTITDNAAVFGSPDAGAITNTVLTIGKTFWMDGLDSSGVYRKTLISCTWAWVEAAKTGPNFDKVWNGTPLPGHTAD